MLEAETEIIAETDVFIQVNVTPEDILSPSANDLQQSLCGTSEEGGYASNAYCLGWVPQEKGSGEQLAKVMWDSFNRRQAGILVSPGKTLWSLRTPQSYTYRDNLGAQWGQTK